MKRLSSLSTLLVFLLLVFAALPADAAGNEHAYIGADKCKKCHIKEYKSWSETKMAKAFEILRPGERAEQKTTAGLDPNKDYTADSECVSCHVTGYNQKGGFVDESTTPELVGVGCEMCHGAGGTYVADEYMSLKNKEYKRADIAAVGSIYPPTEAECQVCHNQDSPFVGEGYVFDFEQRKQDGTHEVYPLKYEH